MQRADSARLIRREDIARPRLAGANWSVVADELSYRDFSSLWGHFGLGMNLFEDYKEFQCVRRATCEASATFICTSNC